MINSTKVMNSQDDHRIHVYIVHLVCVIKSELFKVSPNSHYEKGDEEDPSSALVSRSP